LTSFPHHGDVLALRDSIFTDLTSLASEDPVAPSIFGINAKFKIDEISTNLSIDEWELIGIKIFDQCKGVSWVEEDLSIRLSISDSW